MANQTVNARPEDSSSPSLTRHFPLRDQEVRWALGPSDVTERILKMTHGQEHRDRMASVFKEMKGLPKCEACGSVSKPFWILCFFPSPDDPFFFSFSSNILCATTAICGSGTD